MLAIGQQAPSFNAESTQGPLHLSDYFGKQPVVLIFTLRMRRRFAPNNCVLFAIPKPSMPSTMHW